MRSATQPAVLESISRYFDGYVTVTYCQCFQGSERLTHIRSAFPPLEFPASEGGVAVYG